MFRSVWQKPSRKEEETAAAFNKKDCKVVRGHAQMEAVKQRPLPSALIFVNRNGGGICRKGCSRSPTSIVESGRRRDRRKVVWKPVKTIKIKNAEQSNPNRAFGQI